MAAVLRDMRCNAVPLACSGVLHGTAARAGALVVIALWKTGLPPGPASLTAMGFTMVLRLAALKGRIGVPCLSQDEMFMIYLEKLPECPARPGPDERRRALC